MTTTRPSQGLGSQAWFLIPIFFLPCLVFTHLKQRGAVKNKVRDEACLTRYQNLTEPEVTDLVIEQKWMSAIGSSICDEVERISQTRTFV